MSPINLPSQQFSSLRKSTRLARHSVTTYFDSKSSNRRSSTRTSTWLNSNEVYTTVDDHNAGKITIKNGCYRTRIYSYSVMLVWIYGQ